MKSETTEPSNLTGMMLVAMPSMPDPRFARSVIYLCAHSGEGAMGLVVNCSLNHVTLKGIAEQLGLESSRVPNNVAVVAGGPVESSRGFLMHTPDILSDTTMKIDDQFALTATVETLRAVIEGNGPKRCLFALGYAGWAPGQLDNELQSNGWLVAPARGDIVFDSDTETKWARALGSIGVDPMSLSSAAGNA